MARWSTLAGMEVPVLGSDSVKWIDLSLPSSPSTASPSSLPFAPLSDDYASCSLIRDSPTYFAWRIHKAAPHALELLELCSHQKLPQRGLRIVFPDSLSPFAFLCKAENSGNHLLLYALTVSGVAYLIKLKDISAYASSSVIPSNEFIEFHMQAYNNLAAITAVAAIDGYLVVGRNDGSVGCFQLLMLDHGTPGFVHELRDDAGIVRLWGLMSRGRIVGAVQSLVISDVLGRKLVFVLHSDGVLRIWDLSSHSRVLSHTISSPTFQGATFAQLWVSEVLHNSNIFPFAILCKHSTEDNSERIHVYSLRYNFADKIVLLVEPSVQSVLLEEGGCIDVKITSDKIYVLKENGLVYHSLLAANATVEEAHFYTLQEEFVADQLFQNSEHSSDDLLWMTHSIFSSMKIQDRTVPFVSSVFLRRLLHPGVHHNIALRATFLDYNRHWTDSEFQSLTAGVLKKEILLLIEQEGTMESPLSMLCCWKNFCSRYFHYWCKNNAPFGLLLESSTGAVGLIRKNSVSLFRCSDNIELLTHGSSNEVSDRAFAVGLSGDDLDHDILLEVLRCIMSVSQQLGRTASPIYYESLVSIPVLSPEEIVLCLLKILETGYSSSVTSHQMADLGADIALEKGLTDHKNLRKFSIDMLLSLFALREKATSWNRVLEVIESYIKFLVPPKTMQKGGAEMLCNMNTSIVVQSSSQVAKVMFEAALDILLFLVYMVKISGQINMLQDDISKIQSELIPMVRESISEWLIIHFFCTTPSESPSDADFSSQLSSLKIDSNFVKNSWNEKLGKCDFTLAFILLLNSQSSSGDECYFPLKRFPSPRSFIALVQNFSSLIIWGSSGKESCAFLSQSTELALTLLRHGQCDAVECLLNIVEAHSWKEKSSGSVQDTDGKWCILHHLLGLCLLIQSQGILHGVEKEKKLCEAIRCFFRASSGHGASQALQGLSSALGFPFASLTGPVSPSGWKLLYYQWAMQIFEQYNISEGACQFALAALEQVEEDRDGDDNGRDPFSESAITIKGRLWANVFKFTLDLNHFYDAYCAMITNPDEESKYICLRRFFIVLNERGATKILCNGQLPFIALTEKVERELAWKAERSDISAKPNPYKVFYSFEMYRHNWRKAATYMYLYSNRLRTEAALKDNQQLSLVLQERLNGLSTAINALHLAHPSYAWIDPLLDDTSLHNGHYPSKRLRKAVEEQNDLNGVCSRKTQFCVDIEKLENEFMLTSAEYLLLLANVRWTFTGTEKAPSDLVDLLVQANLYDMTFTILLKFWKGSGLQRELEKVFSMMTLKCCLNSIGSSFAGNGSKLQNLLLTSSRDEASVHGSLDMSPMGPTEKSKGNSQWETLELYLGKYKVFHARLPIIVAETLLRTDPHIELPLWLVHMFKDGRREGVWDMTGKQSSPSSLLRLYVDHGRYTEATNLLLEYTESFASMRPAGIINRKKPFAVWFPYTTIERLWCQLEELMNTGHMADQCDKLRRLLHGALLNHLKLLKVDSDDAQASAMG